MYTTEIPGLPGGPLTTSFPVHIKLCPAWRTLNRPGIKAASPRRSVQHGNGNPNSSAAGEATFLSQGCPDAWGNPQQTSYHSAIDDTECWLMIPADEVAWQAADGAGPGNMCGFSCEQVEDADLWADQDRAKRCIANAAEWMGTISARLNIAIPEQHWTFNAADPNRHDCPNRLRHTAGAWASYTVQWSAAKAAELARMGGAPAEPAIHWVRPTPIHGLPNLLTLSADTPLPQITGEGTTFTVVFDVYEAVRETHRYQRSTGAEEDIINAAFHAGDRVLIVVTYTSGALGDLWGLTRESTRIWLKDWKRVADASGAFTRG